jgi:hypothetical protein
MLAENIMLTDSQRRRSPAILQVLRGLTDDAPGKKTVPRPYPGRPRYIYVRAYGAAGSHLDIFINHRIRAHSNRRVEPRLRMDDCGRMNHVLKSERTKSVAKPKLSASSVSIG